MSTYEAGRGGYEGDTAGVPFVREPGGEGGAGCPAGRGAPIGVRGRLCTPLSRVVMVGAEEVNNHLISAQGLGGRSAGASWGYKETIFPLVCLSPSVLPAGLLELPSPVHWPSLTRLPFSLDGLPAPLT